MRLHEYQAKRILSQRGISTPEGGVAYTPGEAHEVAAQLRGRVVVKAQVLAPGRGRAGGIRVAEGPEAAELAAQEIMSLAIGGLPVRRVLVERAIDIRRQMYMGLALQPTGEVQFTVASEAAPFTEPPRTIALDYGIGLLPFQVRELAFALGLPQRATEGMVQMGLALWDTLIATDALWVELNPLALTPVEDLVVVDSKITLDDNALYRHPELAELREAEELTPAESEARRYGLYYVGLDGNVGSLVNGAGLAMATSDAIEALGGRSANILDVGGGARAQRVAAGMNILLRDARLRSILVAIFGGITRCDEVAAGILAAIQCSGAPVPIYVRLTGTNEHEGRQMLAGAPVTLVSDLYEGARLAVATAEAA
ncbi:MAG: succinate--CoA ligase subunit beta [Anaerolineae bacterium]|nr:succinate--CoA ligase subunit beta [Anaerolineae bacterium]